MGSPRLGHAWATEQQQQVIKVTKENRGGYDAREWEVERRSPQAVRRWATWGLGRVSEAGTASTRALKWVPAENVLGTVVLIFSRLEGSWGQIKSFLSMQACYIERMSPSRGSLVSLISEQVGLVTSDSLHQADFVWCIHLFFWAIPHLVCLWLRLGWATTTSLSWFLNWG